MTRVSRRVDLGPWTLNLGHFVIRRKDYMKKYHSIKGNKIVSH